MKPLLHAGHVLQRGGGGRLTIGTHSSPVFGSVSHPLRSGMPMIFASCGLTVPGTGTDFAGTCSMSLCARTKVAGEIAASAIRPSHTRRRVPPRPNHHGTPTLMSFLVEFERAVVDQEARQSHSSRNNSFALLFIVAWGINRDVVIRADGDIVLFPSFGNEGCRANDVR